jgi:hypothetical protein
MFHYTQSTEGSRQDAIDQTPMFNRKYFIDTLIGMLGLVILTWTVTSTILVSITLIQQPGDFQQRIHTTNLLCLLPLMLVPPYGYFGFLIGGLALVTRGFPPRDSMDLRRPL